MPIGLTGLDLDQKPKAAGGDALSSELDALIESLRVPDIDLDAILESIRETNPTPDSVRRVPTPRSAVTFDLILAPCGANGISRNSPTLST